MSATKESELDFVMMKARDVVPFGFGVWCTVGGRKEPFVNTIVSNKWSEDGKSLWWMLESHNFHNPGPDEMVQVVRLKPSQYFAAQYANWSLGPPPDEDPEIAKAVSYLVSKGFTAEDYKQALNLTPKERK